VTVRPRTIHRVSAFVLALFVFFHLLNHLALAAGSDVHLLMSGVLVNVPVPADYLAAYQ
jgi:succinate dehydrogenase/fumarate reductase cytochrome b subunit